MGLSGVSVWGSDIGGFFALGDNRLTPELLDRWVQFGAVSGVMRTKYGGVAVPAKERPQVFDPERLPNWRRYAKLRTQLYPYIAGADREYRATRRCRSCATCRSSSRTTRSAARQRARVHVRPATCSPRRWSSRARASASCTCRAGAGSTSGARSTTTRARGGLRLRRASRSPGGRRSTLPAPARRAAAAGARRTVLPLLPPDVDTLADYGAGDARPRAAARPREPHGAARVPARALRGPVRATASRCARPRAAAAGP